MRKPFLSREERVRYNDQTFLGSQIRLKLAAAKIRKEIKDVHGKKAVKEFDDSLLGILNKEAERNFNSNSWY